MLKTIPFTHFSKGYFRNVINNLVVKLSICVEQKLIRTTGSVAGSDIMLPLERVVKRTDSNEMDGV